MPSRQAPIEIGMFAIVRKRSGQAVILRPQGIKSRNDPIPHLDDRTAQADDRAREMLALLRSGEVRNRAELARRLGISKARITQILRRPVIAALVKGGA